jgi:hypothetical protein
MAAKSKMTTDGRRVNVAAPRTPRTTNTSLADQHAPVQTDDERKLKRLQRMHPEQLIALACRCLDDMFKAQAEYALITQILGDRFPKEKHEEALVTSAGIATRKVKNEYILMQDRVQDLRVMLDKEFSLFISTEESYSVPTDRIGALREALGSKAKKFIKEDLIFKVTPLLRAQLRDPYNELTRRLEGIVKVASKVTVTVTPPTS